MRAFIAIDITSEIRRQLAEFIDQNRGLFAGARWVRPENMHVTLKFLGAVPVEQQVRIEAVLSRVKSPPFEISIRGLGFFPNVRSPRVFWAGIHAGDELPALASAVEQALLPLGFPQEKQSYRPHLTLARFDPRKKVQGLAGAAQCLMERSQPDFGTMTCTDFFLYESKLSSQGSRYTKLARLNLLDSES